MCIYAELLNGCMYNCTYNCKQTSNPKCAPTKSQLHTDVHMCVDVSMDIWINALCFCPTHAFSLSYRYRHACLLGLCKGSVADSIR